MKNLKIALTSIIFSLILFPACRKKQGGAPIKQLSWSQQADQAQVKKKLLILSSSGGGGHTAASNAIHDYLKDDYQIEITNVFEEVLLPLDPIHAITRGSYSGEDLYNFFLKTNARWCANNTVALGKLTMNWQSGQIQPLLEEFLAHNKPDALISVIPVLNGNILAVAQKMNIPFGIIALDRDMEAIGFLNGIWHPDYKKFIFGIPFVDESLKKHVMQRTLIPEDQIRAIGVPVRTSFLEQKDTTALRKEFAIPVGKPVIMVLMGSVGSGATFRYARALTKVKTPVHIILCLGKNEQLRQKIADHIVFPPHVSVSVVGFTNRIADYMAVSNMLITKSGSVSLYEALVAGVPIFFDRTREVLAWELMNISFVKERGFGDEFCAMRKVAKAIDAYLKDPTREVLIRKNIAEYHLPKVRETVTQLVADLMAMNNTQVSDIPVLDIDLK